jgi:hypothetical protein
LKIDAPRLAADVRNPARKECPANCLGSRRSCAACTFTISHTPSDRSYVRPSGRAGGAAEDRDRLNSGGCDPIFEGDAGQAILPKGMAMGLASARHKDHGVVYRT